MSLGFLIADLCIYENDDPNSGFCDAGTCVSASGESDLQETLSDLAEYVLRIAFCPLSSFLYFRVFFVVCLYFFKFATPFFIGAVSQLDCCVALRAKASTQP